MITLNKKKQLHTCNIAFIQKKNHYCIYIKVKSILFVLFYKREILSFRKYIIYYKKISTFKYFILVVSD